MLTLPTSDSPDWDRRLPCGWLLPIPGVSDGACLSPPSLPSQGSCVDCQALNSSTCPPNSVKLVSPCPPRRAPGLWLAHGVLPRSRGSRDWETRTHSEAQGFWRSCQGVGVLGPGPSSLLTGLAWPTQDLFSKECVYIHDPTGLNVLKKGCARYCNQTITVSLGRGHSPWDVGPASWTKQTTFLRERHCSSVAAQGHQVPIFLL